MQLLAAPKEDLALQTDLMVDLMVDLTVVLEDQIILQQHLRVETLHLELLLL